MGVSIRLALSLPRDVGSVPLARRVLDGALTAAGVDPDCRYDIGLALGEACANVVAHARAVDRYEVTVSAQDCECAIEVVDTAPVPDPARLSRPLPDVRAERGRGLHIIRAVMDAVEIVTAPTGGLIVRMIKRLAFAGAEPGPAAGSAPGVAPRRAAAAGEV